MARGGIIEQVVFMNVVATILGGAVSLVGTYALRDSLHVTFTRLAAFERARELSNDRGIINIGAGPHRIFPAKVIARQPEVLANVDIVLDGLPNFLQLDIEKDSLPFSDKQFGAAFLSHVLEHLDNWQFALDEASRVADYAVVVLPHPAYFSGWLVPEHRQHFSRDDIDEICQLYPNVEVYY